MAAMGDVGMDGMLPMMMMNQKSAAGSNQNNAAMNPFMWEMLGDNPMMATMMMNNNQNTYSRKAGKQTIFY